MFPQDLSYKIMILLEVTGFPVTSFCYGDEENTRACAGVFDDNKRNCWHEGSKEHADCSIDNYRRYPGRVLSA